MSDHQPNQANQIYREQKTITSSEFGSINHRGEIAFIHIDGNHDYESVKEDYELWSPLVKADGWIVLDDYFWPSGDGPKRLGDEILEYEKDKFSNIFVAGKALFLQLKF